MDKLYIVMPAYNEADNIKNVIEQWYPIVEQYNGGGESRLVIIDDGNKDDTYEIMSECAKTRPLLTPLTKENGGHGATILYGYKYAISQGTDYIFQTDSDGQTLPEEFHDFWKERENYDMVIGWRNTREDGFGRIIVTKVLKLVVRMCFHAEVTDANTPFRLMKAKTLDRYIGVIPDEFFLSNVVVAAIFAKKNCKVKYVPITFHPRAAGENKINVKSIINHGKHALRTFPEVNYKIDHME